MTAIGFTLQPDLETLELLESVIETEADYYEVTPETLWRLREDGALEPNGYHRRFLELGERTARPFVAHGVGLSMGTAHRGDAARRRRWLEQIRQDHARFGFLWYTDHLGASSLDGLALTLPAPLPMTAYMASVVRRRLRSLQRIVPAVGVENTANHFVLGDPLDEPRFLNRITSAPGLHLLLDLHNVCAMAENLGFEPQAYLERLDLGRVIEIHVAGGSSSEPRWLPSGRALRMDSHDGAVPESVWSLLEAVAPRCPGLRGVTLERMEGTVEPQDVALLRDEMRRARRILKGLP